MIIGSPEEGSSKPTGVNPNFRRNTTNATQNKGVKRVSSDLTNGRVGKADLFEIQPLKIFNEESGRKAVQDPQKDDFSISESEKVHFALLFRYNCVHSITSFSFQQLTDSFCLFLL